MNDIRFENLAVYMDAKRGSSKRIAKALDIKPPTVSEWKTGKRSIPEEHVSTVCEILGITRKDLTEPFGPFLNDLAGCDMGRVLLRVYLGLPQDAQERVLEKALQEKQSALK
jgi:transcriptional regulator with XRE-family HTH domain